MKRASAAPWRRLVPLAVVVLAVHLVLLQGPARRVMPVRVSGDEVPDAMRIFAKLMAKAETAARREWMEENRTGRHKFLATREATRDQTIEKVGVELRAMMPFLDPVTIKPGE